MEKQNYILLVEDNEDDIDLTLLALKKNNITNEVVVAKNGNEAIEVLSRRYETEQKWPSLILLDLNMPVADGFDVLTKVKTLGEMKKIPVVILTSSNEVSDITKGYELGANSYIRKPVNFNEFINMIHDIGKYWLHINIPPILSNYSQNA